MVEAAFVTHFPIPPIYHLPWVTIQLYIPRFAIKCHSNLNLSVSITYMYIHYTDEFT